MSKNVLIAGCGYLGGALGADLASHGIRVWGLCRSEISLEKVRTAGFEPVRADLNDPTTLTNLPAVDAVVACQAPKRSESYTTVYLDGTSNLIRALKNPAQVRFVFISSTSVYGPCGGGRVEADTPIQPESLEDNARVLRETERAVLTAPVGGMVLRLSGIYGPGRNRLEAIRSGQFVPPMGETWTNRIHCDDAVSAIRAVLEKGQPGQTYLASDDTPATQREVYSWIYKKIGRDIPPAPNTGHLQPDKNDSKRCSNEKLKALGWKPLYPSYQEGYGELIR